MVPAWAAHVPFIPSYPSNSNYPGGAGSPLPYNVVNADGAVGGNPAVGPWLTAGTITYARPDEKGWKDVIKAFPGEVATYIVRFAPTNLPTTATPAQLQFPFDPSIGPGYVWHCHIIDHEDNDMMRNYLVQASPQRYPQITTQPLATTACVGDVTTLSVVGTSVAPITYQWQVSTNAGVLWTNLVDGAPYTGSLTASLTINPATLAMTTYQYRVILTNVDGSTTSNAAVLTVNSCTLTGTLKYNNALLDALSGMTVSANGKFATTDALGAFTITGVTSGVQTITVNPNGRAVGAINSTDAGAANYWFTTPTAIAHVNFLAGDINNDNAINAADALGIQRYFVLNQAFTRAPWSFWNAVGNVTSNTDANRLLPINVTVTGTSVAAVNILAQCTGDFNNSFNPNGPAKGGISNVQLSLKETQYAGANQNIILAIRSVSAQQLGAISLILNIPSEFVHVQDVYINGSSVPATFNVSGNELRIGWNSTIPVSVSAGEDLIILKLNTTSNFTIGKTIEINMVSDLLNELADRYFEVIPNALLETNVIESSALGIGEQLGGDLSLSSYPNPFKVYSTITYNIPVDGNVTLKLYNSIGQDIKTLIDNPMTIGNYTLTVDASSIAQGIYTAVLRVQSENDVKVGLIKLVINK